MDLELAGKVILITGGTDGLGLALAAQLAAEGAAVGVCGRDEERLRAAEAAIRAAGGDVLAQRADVSKAEDLVAFVDAAVARWGRLDGIVHNAGRASGGSLETISDETWESDVQLKLMAAVRLTRLALPHLRANHGAVLFTLALSAKAPGAASEPSSVTRAAGMALMKALSKELAPDGIRVNAVLIGYVESGQWVRIAEKSGMSLPAFYEQFTRDAGIPLGRFGRAAEFADLGCYLLSSRASYVTGTAINLDGGLSPAV
jgi:NAD(P)-dependent dehydrogenase (short-subunit alcohol dehydrogenase family)